MVRRHSGAAASALTAGTPHASTIPAGLSAGGRRRDRAVSGGGPPGPGISRLAVPPCQARLGGGGGPGATRRRRHGDFPRRGSEAGSGDSPRHATRWPALCDHQDRWASGRAAPAFQCRLAGGGERRAGLRAIAGADAVRWRQAFTRRRPAAGGGQGARTEFHRRRQHGDRSGPGHLHPRCAIHRAGHLGPGSGADARRRRRAEARAGRHRPGMGRGHVT